MPQARLFLSTLQNRKFNFMYLLKDTSFLQFVIQCEQGFDFFYVWRINCNGVVLKLHLSCFEISKHTMKTCDCLLCFELGFQQFANELSLNMKDLSNLLCYSQIVLISIGEKVVGRSCRNRGKNAIGCQNWFEETTKMILVLIFIYFLMGSSTPNWALTLGA